ncbi:hypothetical protein OM33_19685 [Pseudoalteromonas piratica]|uniref:Uncharacterized protein n=1 Tax=Pseudoalteromonas piratica TaxID=1348114 RepID=A0A0A7EL58_9GAMM|nr:hypothetical protein OM33_19685 [Pseudoalteromonas piratica]
MCLGRVEINFSIFVLFKCSNIAVIDVCLALQANIEQKLMNPALASTFIQLGKKEESVIK